MVFLHINFLFFAIANSPMDSQLIILIIFLYFFMLVVISRLTTKKTDNKTFFTANKNSPWYVVAFGMIGTSLSGVTFISVPGWVATSQFSYMQMVLGYLLGYLVIANVLLPLYYRLNLTSIYTYLDQRFGKFSYKTGAFYFILSRTIGAAFRLYLVAKVLQIAIFDNYGVPIWVTIAITIALIWLYTYRGGIKTIIWTDTLQTLFMLLAVFVSIYAISSQLDLKLFDTIQLINDSEYSKVFFFDDWRDPKFFWKQFMAGAFIAIVMTGLDQDMMQKNLSCRSLKDAKKNMYSFSLVLVVVNLLFLALGALLYIYASQSGISIPAKGDDLFPTIAIEGHLGIFVGICFILGLIAAAYSSADSALTALTTSVCVDLLEFNGGKNESQKRKWVHVLMSLILFVVILVFSFIADDSVIASLFKVAGYTYGPLLGLYFFGLYFKYSIKDKYVPFICIASPVITYIIGENSEWLLNGYQFGFELILINGLLTFLGLWVIRLSVINKEGVIKS